MDTSSRSGGPEPPTPLVVTLSTGIIKEIPRQPHSGSQTGLSGGGGIEGGVGGGGEGGKGGSLSDDLSKDSDESTFLLFLIKEFSTLFLKF